MVDNISSGIKKYNLLGITFSDLDFNTIIRLAEDSILENKKISVGYVNPHTVRYSAKNNSMQKNINAFTYNHIDGIGIQFACNLLLKGKKFQRLNWTDEAFKFLSKASEKKWKVFLLGSDNETLKDAVNKIKTLFPELTISGSLNGYNDINENTVDKINNSQTNVLWVGLGSITQEKWIGENFDKLNCNIIQSVGDLFSHIAGKRLRGPAIFQKLGLEWMFRLIQHPIKYFDRYVVGIPVFLFLVLKNIFKK